MNRKHLVAAAAAADRDRELKQQRLQDAWTPWHARLRRHHAVVVLGGGFVGGAMLARSPGRWLLRAVSAVAGIASLMLRTPLGSLMIASVATARSPVTSVLSNPD